MKKLIILTLMIMFYQNSFSQDKEATAYEFPWGADPITNRPLEVDSFNIDRFKLGFQWGGSSKMSNALYHNIIHDKVFTASKYDSNFKEDMYVIGQPAVQGIKDMAFIQYEPTLQTSDYRIFNPRPDDPTNAIFGFGNVKGRILTSPGAINYNRLILEKDSMSSYPADSIVLSQITPNDEFFTFISVYSNG